MNTTYSYKCDMLILYIYIFLLTGTFFMGGWIPPLGGPKVLLKRGACCVRAGSAGGGSTSVPAPAAAPGGAGPATTSSDSSCTSK